MEEKIESISAFWKSDKKEVIEWSEAVCVFLLLLKQHNNKLFGTWYMKGRSKKEALKFEVVMETSFFQKDIVKKWDKLFHNLGARISYWTGYVEEDKAAEISFNIGVYGNKPHNRNSCVLGLPKDYDFYRNKENRNLLIKLIIDYWSPEELLINGKETNIFKH